MEKVAVVSDEMREVVERAGLATAHSQRVVAGRSGRMMGVARIRITEAGQRALAEEH